MSEDKLIKRLRHLVSLNEPRHGGPYQGTAAEACVKAMLEAADALAAKDTALSEMRAELERLRKALETATEKCRTMVRERDDTEPRGQGVISGLLYAIQFIEESALSSQADGDAICMWADKPCTCGGGPCEQVDFGAGGSAALALSGEEKL